MSQTRELYNLDLGGKHESEVWQNLEFELRFIVKKILQAHGMHYFWKTDLETFPMNFVLMNFELLLQMEFTIRERPEKSKSDRQFTALFIDILLIV